MYVVRMTIAALGRDGDGAEANDVSSLLPEYRR